MLRKELPWSAAAAQATKVRYSQRWNEARLPACTLAELPAWGAQRTQRRCSVAKRIISASTCGVCDEWWRRELQAILCWGILLSGRTVARTVRASMRRDYRSPGKLADCFSSYFQERGLIFIFPQKYKHRLLAAFYCQTEANRG